MMGLCYFISDQQRLYVCVGVSSQHSNPADVWVGLSYPGVGAPWNMISSQNFARMLSTCYNNRYRRRWFNSNKRQRQDTCKVETGLWFLTIFTNPAFYPHYPHLCLGKWRGWFPLCNLKLAKFGLTLLRLRRTDVKSKVLWPHSCFLT